MVRPIGNDILHPFTPSCSLNSVQLNQHKKRIIHGDLAQQLQALKVACGFVNAANSSSVEDNTITSTSSGSQTSLASSPLSIITELSRPTTQDSTVVALEASHPPVVQVASPIVIQETSKCLCGVCGKYGICGCARRANSSRSNPNKDLGFCTDSGFDVAIKSLMTRDGPAQYGGTTSPGYRSNPASEDQSQKASSDNLVEAEAHSLKLAKTANFLVNGSEMIGFGRYRCSKDASNEFIINNIIEKLGDVADLVVKLGGEDLKVHGHETITYAEVLRIKKKRSEQENPNKYKQEVSSDGIIVQTGFPTRPVPLDAIHSTVPRHLRSGSWTDHDQSARDFKMVHNYGQFGKLGGRPRFSYPISKRELETVKRPRVRSQKVPAAAPRRLHGMEVAPDACIGTLPLGITAQAAEIADAVQLGAAPPIPSFLPGLDKDLDEDIPATPGSQPNAQ